MKYFVTGATGHLGNTIVRTILESEPESTVNILQRKLNNNATDDLRCKRVFGDINNPNSFKEAIDEETIVIHAAGLVDLTGKNKELILKTNYEATINLVNTCIIKHVKKFIYVSSTDSIYKESNLIDVKEPSRLYPEKLKTNYATSKALATYYIQEMARKNPNFCYSIIYPTTFIGPYDYNFSSIGELFKERIKNKKQFSVKGKYNFVDVRDVAKVICTLANNGKNDSFVISGHDVTIEELYQLINNHLGADSKPKKVPMALSLINSSFSKIFPKQALLKLEENYKYDCSKAKGELNYEPRPIEETVNETIDWFVNYLNEVEQ